MVKTAASTVIGAREERKRQQQLKDSITRRKQLMSDTATKNRLLRENILGEKVPEKVSLSRSTSPKAKIKSSIMDKYMLDTATGQLREKVPSLRDESTKPLPQNFEDEY